MSEFLAEARILITPDTTAFRAQLLAEITAATRGISATIPVQIAAATTGATQAARAASQATQEVAAAHQVAGAAAQRRSTVEKELVRVQNASERATRSLALAQAEVTNTTTSLAAAQVTATRASAAARAAARANELALVSGNAALIQATGNTLRLATAQEAQAASALQAARAQSIHSAQLAQTSRGAASAGLSLFGVRGATLAANASFLAGAAALVVFAKSVGLAADLEENLNVFQNAAKATDDEMQQVADTARDLGRDFTLPGVSAVDAAEALTLLTRAGLDVQDSIDAARGSLQLATAAEIDNAEAVKLIATALNAFNLEGTEAARVADLLATSANESQAEITDTGLALQQAAAVANLVGLELSDTIALLTLLQKAGLRGSDAGTSLRTALIRLINPTNDAKKKLAELNLQFRDLEGNIRPEIFAEFLQATEDLGKAGQQELIAEIFGQDAIRAVGLIGRQGAAGLREVQIALEDLQAVENAASARTKGFSGDVEALSSNLETLGADIGTAVIPVISVLVTGLTDASEAALLLTGGISDLANVSVPVLGRIGDRVEDAFNVSTFVGPLGPIRLVGIAMDQFGDETEESADQLTAFDVVGKSAAGTINEIANALLRTAAVTSDVGLSFEQLRGRLAGLEEQAIDIQIAGGARGQQIANLRAQEANIREQLENENLATESRRDLKADLLKVIQDRKSIEDAIVRDREQAARDAQQAAEEAQRARNAADKAFLDSLDIQEQRLQNNLIIAQSTESLRDDIKRNEALRNFFRGARDDVRATVRDAQTRAQEIAALTRDLININNEIADLRRELTEARKEERREQLARQRESLELDVQIAEATGNRAREITARETEIKFLQRRIRATRRESLERKRLIAELRQKQRELRELRDLDKASGEDFKRLAFEFLQTNQGFTTNLASNLLPAGTGFAPPPGAQAPVDVARPPIPSAADARTEARVDDFRAVGKPISASQGTEIIHILRATNKTLRDIHRDQGHPESRTRRVQQRTAVETGVD